MIIFSKKTSLSLRAGAAIALACFVFWAVGQNTAKAPAEIPSKVLLEQLDALKAAGQYEELIRFSDSITALFVGPDLRLEWYKAVRSKAVAQIAHEHAQTAMIQLLPIVQSQILDDSITARLYGLLGYACLNAREFEQGAWYFEQNLSGLLRHQCKVGLGFAYMNLGYALKEQGDHRAAQQYYQSALILAKKEGYAPNISETLINLGDISRSLFDYEKAREYYKMAAVAYPEKEGRLAEHLGWSYSDERRYGEALSCFKESYKQGASADKIARIMGRCAEALGDTAEANRQYHLALESAKTARDSGIAQSYIGRSLLQRKQPEAALRVFQQALHAFFPPLPPNDLTANPSVGQTAEFWHVELLRGKAHAFQALFEKTGEVKHLKNASSAVSTAIAALDTLRINLRNEESGQDAVDYAYATYETGIQIALRLERVQPGRGYLAKAYEIAECAKSNVLKTNLLEKDLRRSIQIPDSLLWQEKKARAAVAYWESAGRPDSLLTAVRQLGFVRSEIEKGAPSLGKARLQSQNISLASIQDALQEGELLIQYFWGDSTVIVFAVSKEQIQTHSLPRTTALNQSVDSLRSALTQWHMPQDAYKSTASAVYRQFCGLLEERTGQAQRLIIVPDGPLSTVPFEALVASNGRFLVQDYAISYHWSGALWLQARKQGNDSTKKNEYGGFAPEYKSASRPMASLGPELGDLPEARAAVVAAANAWGGTVCQGPTVNKGLFQREAGNYGILHLAMHGLLDMKDRTRTGLAFPTATGDSIDLLNTLEISQMDLSAQLAVLTACNTGSGVVFRGEGVMSLSRAFALAGCPAMTANLWEVPSRETNDITTAFLSLLKKGESKDEALRSAKLDFLDQAETERRHPFFWAGQVLVGNEGPLCQSYIWVWVLLGTGLLGSLGWLIWRRLRKKGLAF